jgi:hypothetical protein
VSPFAGPGCALQRDLVVESTGDPGRRGGCAHAAHLECNAGVGEPCGASASLRGHVLVLRDRGNHPARYARVSERIQRALMAPLSSTNAQTSAASVTASWARPGLM